jgi:hypothetical protein
MRAQNEVKDEVLARACRYRVVHPKRDESDASSPLDVKEVWVEDRATLSGATRTRPARMPRIGKPSWRRCVRNSRPERSH